MKASVLYGINDLRYIEDYPIPTLKDNEVLVRVSHAGICGSDVNRVFKNGTYHFPTVIGHEFSGIVVKSADSSGEWLGKKVGVFPLIPCFECPSCKSGNYEMCDHYDYLGSRCDGGFEEYVAVPKWNLVELPQKVELKEAAMLEPISVGIHALNFAGNIDGKTLAIIGPGTIGNIIAKLATIKKAKKVIMIGRTQEKLNFANQYSEASVINSTKADVNQEVLNLTNNLGADIVIEGTGASDSLTTAIKIAAKGGEIVLMGNPIGNFIIEKNVYWSILRKQLTLHGTWNSSFKSKKNDWLEALSLLESGKLDLSKIVSHILPFDKLPDGLKIMQDKSIFSNKVMLVNND